MPTQESPVQIWCPTGNDGGYALDRKALEKILTQPDVVDTPVAIYAVAGAFRKGKSCMLNMMLKYLKANRADGSMTQSADVLKGFEFRGGSKKCTEGIWIWNKPFFILVDGRKVAIFLLDCQGAFDHQSSLKGVSSVFALSTLFSSVQIFNIMQQIQENDLQHLQLFIEYGQLAKQGAHGMKGTPFQSLLFLIRDFPDPDYDFGIKGGKEYLETVLKPQSSIKEIEAVRKNIRDSFENVECALIPFPGDKVAIRRATDPPITLEDFNDDFLEEVRSLMKYLFVDNIALKRMNGKPITGNDLYYLIAACCNEFESDRMPKLDNIVEASARASLVALTGKLTEEYAAMMKKECDGGPMDPMLLQKLHQKVKEEMLKKFQDTLKMGGTSMVQQYHEKLTELMDAKFPLFQQINIAQKIAEENKASPEQIAQLKESFQNAVKEQTSIFDDEMRSRDAKFEKLLTNLRNQQSQQPSVWDTILNGAFKVLELATNATMLYKLFRK